MRAGGVVGGDGTEEGSFKGRGDDRWRGRGATMAVAVAVGPARPSPPSLPRTSSSSEHDHLGPRRHIYPRSISATLHALDHRPFFRSWPIASNRVLQIRSIALPLEPCSKGDGLPAGPRPSYVARLVTLPSVRSTRGTEELLSTAIVVATSPPAPRPSCLSLTPDEGNCRSAHKYHDVTHVTDASTCRSPSSRARPSLDPISVSSCVLLARESSTVG